MTEADMERVIETAKAIAIPNDQVVLHAAAGIHHRWAGRCTSPAWHERPVDSK